jgi:hypothetical protein
MTFDLEEMLRSKKKFREQLAAKPIAEKLRLLDAMRERAVVIRAAKSHNVVNAREEPPPYGNR